MKKNIIKSISTCLIAASYLLTSPVGVAASSVTFIYENEIGNTPYTATPIVMSSTTLGHISGDYMDIDYYSFHLDETRDISIVLSSLNQDTIQYYNLELLSSNLEVLYEVEYAYDFGFFGRSEINATLDKGHYFVKISSNNTPVTVNRQYSLSLSDATPFPGQNDTIQKIDLPGPIADTITNQDVIHSIISTDSRMAQNYNWYMDWIDKINYDVSIYESTLVPFQYHLPQINVFEAWEETMGSSEIIVAVIDQGIDTSNPALKNNTLEVVNTYDPSITTPITMQHGTHTAGIVGANLNTGIGVSGIAPNITIMPIDAWDETGSIRTEQSTADAIIYAVDNGARVISMSLGPVGDDLDADNPIIHEAIQYAYNNDVVLIASAGNHGSDKLHAPAKYDEVISVGAVNGNDEIWAYSNRGADLVAPGENIYSLSTDNDFLLMSGTSMSTPMVAATAGLILSKNPDLTNEQVKEILLSSTDYIGDESIYGSGRLNVGQAIRLTPESENNMPLLPDDKWYSSTIQKMYDTNLIHYSWAPPHQMDSDITWKELKILVSNFFPLPTTTLDMYGNFSDWDIVTRGDFFDAIYNLKYYLMGDSLQDQSLDSIDFLTTHHIIQGREDGELALTDSITWAETLIVLNNFHHFRLNLQLID